VSVVLQAKHIGLLGTFDSACKLLTDQKVSSKRKASKDIDELREPFSKCKQPKIVTAGSTLTQTMLDEYVLVRLYHCTF